MSKELKQLFENAGIQGEVGEKALSIFEAAVLEAADAQVAQKIGGIQESLEARFEEVKEAWLQESKESLDALTDEVLAEWASDNSVAIDGMLKVQVAESFLQTIGSAMVNEGFALKNEGSTLTEKHVEEVDRVSVLNETLQTQLEESTTQLNNYRKEEILSGVTKGMSLVGADRVRSLCAKLKFEGIESFKGQAIAIAEAFGSLKEAEDKKGDEDKEDKGADKDDADDKGVDAASDKEDGDEKKEEMKGSTGVVENYDPAVAAANFLKTGRIRL